MTAAELTTLIADVDRALDAALPLLGAAEIQPIADLLAGLFARAVTAAAAAQPTLVTEVQAVESASAVAEDLKFPPR